MAILVEVIVVGKYRNHSERVVWCKFCSRREDVMLSLFVAGAVFCACRMCGSAIFVAGAGNREVATLGGLNVAIALGLACERLCFGRLESLGMLTSSSWGNRQCNLTNVVFLCEPR